MAKEKRTDPADTHSGEKLAGWFTGIKGKGRGQR
jgi:hypothetical protein